MDISKEEKLLNSVKDASLLQKLKVYFPLTGPGWLQSAITLGGGSLASALFLGTMTGMSFLWINIVSIIFGVIMLATVSYITLSTKESIFVLMKKNINPALAWGWLLACLVASVVWAMPQFSLIYSTIDGNFLGGSIHNSKMLQFFISIIILALVFVINYYYQKGVGLKTYNIVLKSMVGLIVITFVVVVVTLLFSGKVSFSEIIKGFIPNVKQLFSPVDTYNQYILQITNPEVREYWSCLIVGMQRDIIIASFATAVGINMTFLFPYSLKNQGWNKSFRGFAIFDLITTMLIPFIIVVSCIAIASAFSFHGKPYNDLLVKKDNQWVLSNNDSAQAKAYQKNINKRQETIPNAKIEEAEKYLSALIIKRDNKDFSKSIENIFGSKLLANLIFGIGVLGMGISTATILMLICGMTFSEAFGSKSHKGKYFLIGCAVGAIGPLLWPFLWTGESKAALAIPTSVFGYILFPIAFIAFFLLINSKKTLGEEILTGKRKIISNILIIIALSFTGIAAVITALNKGKIAIYGIVVFLIAIVITHFTNKNKTEDNKNIPPEKS